MTTLYVTRQGASIRRVSQRIQVCRGQETLETVRLRDLERLVLVGNIDLTAGALTALLEAGVETVLLSYAGKFRGRLCPAEGRNIFLRRVQFQRYEDDAFRLQTAQTLLDAKARNGRAVLQRYAWNHPEVQLGDAVARMQKSQQRLRTQTSLESLLGVEGDCARAYFQALGSMMRAGFTFTTRSRRPPGDPVNALLSFGYTLLTTELTGAVAGQGMDPYVGVLHELDYGRPSLALDILEEFRQPIVDRLVLSLINRGAMQREHFEDRGAGGVFLNDAGRPRFLEAYHRALETEFDERESGQRVTYRALLQRQAGRMRAAIEGTQSYAPYLMR